MAVLDREENRWRRKSNQALKRFKLDKIVACVWVSRSRKLRKPKWNLQKPVEVKIYLYSGN